MAQSNGVSVAISGAELFDRTWKMAAALWSYLDAQVFCAAVANAVKACAGSCFPPLDTYDDLHLDGSAEETTARQKQL